jgi:hypothetical protein
MCESRCARRGCEMVQSLARAFAARWHCHELNAKNALLCGLEECIEVLEGCKRRYQGWV